MLEIHLSGEAAAAAVEGVEEVSMTLELEAHQFLELSGVVQTQQARREV